MGPSILKQFSPTIAW